MVERRAYAELCMRCSGMGLVWPKPESVAAAEGETEPNEDAIPVSHAGFRRWMGGGL